MSDKPSQIEKSLRRMYKLGVEHGRQLAEKDMKIKELQKSIAELASTKDNTESKVHDEK